MKYDNKYWGNLDTNIRYLVVIASYARFPQPKALGAMDAAAPVTRFRTIWISDIHLGTRGCSADALLDFLKFTDSEYLYLVGDIIDGWRLRKSWYWAQSHNDVIQRLLVIHGDDYDGVVRHARWLAVLGDGAYNLMLGINYWFNRARRRLGYPYWSLSAYLKGKVKNAVEYVSRFEEAVAEAAARRG